MTASPPRRGTPEQVVFLAAVAVLAALLAGIAFLGLRHRDPAVLLVEQVGGLRERAGQTYLRARVSNSGDETAQAVQVVAELTVEEQVVAEGEQSVDFLSGGESETIVFLFPVTEPGAAVRLRVASFTEP